MRDLTEDNKPKRQAFRKIVRSLRQAFAALFLTGGLVFSVTVRAEPLPNPDGLCLADAYEYLSDDTSVFREVTWAETDLLLQSEGTHVFLIGGPWCTNTSPVVGYINEVAKEYGVETIYLFDLRLDGATADTHVRESDGAERRGSVITGSRYNYLYGEMVERYLINLDSFVEQNLASGDTLTFRNREGEVQEVPKAQVPFLFVYNRDNRDEAGNPAPIVAALEEMKERDDFLYIDGTIDKEKEEEYRELLRKTVFEAVKDNPPSSWTDSDFIEALYGVETEEALTATLRQIKWQLKQKQDTLVLVGRRNDPSTKQMLEAAEREAKANGAVVYLFDPQLDGAVGADVYGYEKTPDITDEASGFAGLYASLVSDRMANLGEYTEGTLSLGEGKADAALPALPFLVAVNPTRRDEDAHPAPVFALAENAGEAAEVFEAYMLSQGLTYQAPAASPEEAGETETQEEKDDGNASPGSSPDDSGIPSEENPSGSSGSVTTEQKNLTGSDAIRKLLAVNQSRLWAGAILLLIVGIGSITILTKKPLEEEE